MLLRNKKIRKHKFVSKKTLSNGLSVVVFEMPWAQSVSVRFLVKAGPRYESKKTIGSAHYLEHMFLEGSGLYPSRRKLDNAIKKRGGFQNAFTGKEYVMYQAKLPPETASFAPEFLRELIFNPKMKKDAVEKEKGIITSELRRSIDDPSNHRWNLLHEHIWKGHPLGNNTLGTFESIRKINRQDLIKYHDRFYRPNNSLIVIAGNISSSKAFEIAEVNFGDISNNNYSLPNIPPPKRDAVKRVKIEERDIKQVHLLIAFDTNGLGRASKQMPQIKVLSRLIGYSIFYKFVYELGYSYIAHCSSWLVGDGGNIVILIEVAPKNLDKSVLKIVEVINKLKINNTSIQESKAGEVAKTVLNLADTNDYAHFIGEQELYTGEVKSPDMFKSEIQAVTVKQIQHLKNKLIRNQNTAMVVLGAVSKNNESKYSEMFKLA